MKLNKHLISLVAAAIIAMVPASAFAATGKAWEIVRAERHDARSVVKDQEMEVKTAKGVIIVTTSRPTPIKVFTILGQLISSDTLQAGTSQLSLGVHGVYIIKVGDLTCKVAL